MGNGEHVKNYIKWLEKHRGTCRSHSKVRLNYAEIPRMCLEQSGRVRTYRNHRKGWESIGRLQKTLEGVGNHWKLQNMWLVTGKTSGRLGWQTRWCHSTWHEQASGTAYSLPHPPQCLPVVFWHNSGVFLTTSTPPSFETQEGGLLCPVEALHPVFQAQGTRTIFHFFPYILTLPTSYPIPPFPLHLHVSPSSWHQKCVHMMCFWCQLGLLRLKTWNTPP